MSEKTIEDLMGSFDELRAKRKALNNLFIGAVVEEDMDAMREALTQVLENETRLIQSEIMPLKSFTAFITLTALREVVKAIETRHPEAAEEATRLQGCISSTVVEINTDTIKRAKEGEG